MNMTTQAGNSSRIIQCGMLVRGCLATVLVLSMCAHAMTTAELQSAIDATPDGGRVELTGDVDLTAPLNVDGRKLTLASPEGERYTITRASGTTRFLAKIENANTLFRLENLEFDGNKAAYGGSGPEEAIIEIARGVVELGAGTVLRDVLVKSGGSIFVHTAGKLVMEDGAEIRDFTNPSYGAAVRVGGSSSYADGTFEMRGGLITGCHSSYAAQNMGGAVYLWGGRFAMSGGVISNNTAVAGGVAGVNLFAGDCDIRGDAQIIDNHGGAVDDFIISGGGSRQVYVRPGYTGRMTIYQSSLPEVGTRSDVWTGSSGTTYATGLGNVSIQGHPDYVLDGYYSSGGYSRWGRKTLEVSSRGVMATVAELWASPLMNDDVVTLSTNLVWASNWTIENVTNVTFTSDANGPWSLERGKENFQFMAVQNASVRFENIALDGRGDLYPITSAANPDNSLLLVKNNGRVIFGSGAVLRNAKSNQRAPGVVLDGTNSVFRMEEGSAIVGCDATGSKCYASAVMVGNGRNDEPRPRFEMAGGVISNCTCNIDTAQASVSGGYGGIVYVYGGWLEMMGGRITENHSTTTCSGVQYYSGVWQMSGDARVEGNDGPYRDAFVRDGQSANVRAVGDFRGHIGISSTTALNTSARVSVAEGASGAWCFFPTLRTELPHAVGMIGPDGKTVYWGTVVGRIGDAEFVTKADAEKACPSSLKLDEAGRAQLPIVFGGVATEIEKTITLDFDPDTMLTFMEARREPLVLFRADEGTSFTGTIQFMLPEGCDDRFLVHSRGSVCKLDMKRGMVFIVR